MIWLSFAYAATGVCSTWLPPEVVEVEELASVQSSGLIAHDGEFLTMGDAGSDPKLYTFNAQGDYLAEQMLDGAENVDWEDLAVGPCGSDTCFYVADIGDNDEVRDTLTIWRAPATDEARLTATACTLAYDDGPHDAEALLLMPSGEVRIVTKEGDGEAKIYYVESLSCDGSTQTLTREAELELSEAVTGGAVGANGALVALRGNTTGWIWRGCDLDWAATPETITFVGEEQGEALAFGPDDTIYTTSEGDPMELHVLPCDTTEALECEECGCASAGALPGVGVGMGVLAALRRRTRVVLAS